MRGLENMENANLKLPGFQVTEQPSRLNFSVFEEFADCLKLSVTYCKKKIL